MGTTLTFSETRTQELREHQNTFHSFSKLVLFARLHVALMLVCLAMAFVGHVPVLDVLLDLGGTLALMVAFAAPASAPGSDRRSASHRPASTPA